MGVAHAVSLVLGAAIGVWKLPSKKVRAAMMAFGGGALIEALSIELFAHILDVARGGHRRLSATQDRRLAGAAEVDRGLVFIALGSAVCGGLLFAWLDHMLSNHGAFLRKASTVQAYVGRLRRALMTRLIGRLRQVPMFEVLSPAELERLARSTVKERYAAGSVIFQELKANSSIFFLLSGSVELAVTTKYASGGLRPGAEAGGGVQADDVAFLPPGHEEVTDHFRLRPNDIFGDMSLFSSETLQAQAVAVERSTVLRIPSSAVHKMLASNRRLQDFVTMTAIDRLRETEVFARCTPSTVARLVSFMRQAEFEAGDTLFYDVDALCPIYFVVLGSVEVSAGSLHGEGCLAAEGRARHVVRANGLLGTEHLVHARAVTATAVALERTTVLVIQRGDVDKLCERDERFRQALVASAPSAHAPTLELEPPEGAAPPTKLGRGAFEEEFGWERTEAPPACTGAASAQVPRSADAPVAREADEASDELPEEDAFLSLPTGHALPDLWANHQATAHPGGGKEGGHAHDGGSKQAALMIWLGILIDAVPESVVMGILVNTASMGQLLAFVVGVFLANFPEAMSSAGVMKQHGMRREIILPMWSSITVLTGIGAMVGSMAFPPGSEDDPSIQKIIAAIEGMCGGAMLCMIANTVLPEAFEQGGNVTGMSALLGFLIAIAVSVAA
ncbi:unnamed protein product [Prorocentrum cordatum]|uniref:Cyclic nucleotide-binding domain-containing protein n=1 Tax=Prorocentrum cordatum TaxID=2364126 RepID=A0ABN9Q439_9DINO|nr:unnamed protein product [Polarella glacialis]